tara:strand:- start:157 stop:615 length:459 start_codon:yes stop_codon:yes gene_type:complete
MSSRFRDTVEKPKNAFVIVVRKGKSGPKILLQKRRGGPGDGMLGLPGGKINYREDPKEAARRECKEETGIDLTNLQYAGENWDAAIFVSRVTSRWIYGPEKRYRNEVDMGWGFKGHMWYPYKVQNGKVIIEKPDIPIWKYTQDALDRASVFL